MTKIISGKEVEKLLLDYSNEIERLQIYGLIDLELDEFNKPYRIRITNKGKLFLEQREI